MENLKEKNEIAVVEKNGVEVIEKSLNDNYLELKKPVLIDGEMITKIKYDFESLTGKNVNAAFAAARKNGYMITGAYEMDPILGCYMFAQAAGIDYLDVKRFSAVDYKRAGSIGRDFFISDLGGDQVKDI